MAVALISPEELTAIQAFANAIGRRWKHELNYTYWYNARIWRDADGDSTHGAALHGLRNRLGATWLMKFKLPKA